MYSHGKTGKREAGVNPEDNSIHKANPCPMCARSIIQAGIRNVIMRTGEGPEQYTIVPAKELEWYLDDSNV